MSDRAPWRRDSEAGIAGGVIAGLASRLGLDVTLLRVLFVVVVILTGGLALAVYGLAWVAMPSGDRERSVLWRRPSRRGPGRGLRFGFGVGLLTLAALLVFRELGIWWSDALVWPLVLAAAGAALLWSQSRTRQEPLSAATTGETTPPRGPPASAAAQRGPDSGTRFLDLYRGGFGIALVIGAALLFLSQNDALGGARDAAFTAIVAIFALALILAPFIWQLGRNLASERAERIRSQERAELAAHLHDSASPAARRATPSTEASATTVSTATADMTASSEAWAPIACTDTTGTTSSMAPPAATAWKAGSALTPCSARAATTASSPSTARSISSWAAAAPTAPSTMTMTSSAASKPA